MNLQEVLDYRTNCIICQKEMIIQLEPKKTWTSIKPEGLKIKTSKTSGYFLFGFDGKFSRNNQKPGAYHKFPLLFTKRCPTCNPRNKKGNSKKGANIPPPATRPIKLKSRSVGPTTMVQTIISHFQNSPSIDNIKNVSCYYTFSLEMKSQDEYDIKLMNEQIRYPSEEAFHHVYTDFVKNKTSLSYGFFNKSIYDVLHLESTSKMLNQIKTKEDLMSKFKLYQLFS